MEEKEIKEQVEKIIGIEIDKAEKTEKEIIQDILNIEMGEE